MRSVRNGSDPTTCRVDLEERFETKNSEDKKREMDFLKCLKNESI